MVQWRGPIPAQVCYEVALMDEQHNINESNEKIRVSTTIKRGTGTRDQDTHKLKVRADNPADAAMKLDHLIAEMRARNTFETMRLIQNVDDQ